MTKSEAQMIKKWREVCPYQVIASMASNHWPDHGYTKSDYNCGKQICKLAAKTLGEDPDGKEWK